MSLIFEEVFTKEVIGEALDYLETRKDSCGIDGVYLSDLREFWSINAHDILELLDKEEYIPGKVRLIEIVNCKGKKRNIALYNSLDRLILRCLSQRLQIAYDPVLNESCYAYRTGLGVEAAVQRAADYLEEGFVHTTKIDISKYFDSIPIDRIERLIRDTIDDAKIRRLVEKYLHMEIEEDGRFFRKQVGLIQGSPLSPFLSNLYLQPFDNRMSEEGRRFCRFGDDIIFFHKTSEEAAECYETVKTILEEEYLLHLNEEKSGIFEGLNQKYLGYSFNRDKKSGKITARRKQKKPELTYHRWNQGAIQKVDRSYHIINNGILSKRDYNILFENDDGKKYIPVETARAINIYSNVIFSSEFFNFVSDKRLDVNLFDRFGNCIGYFSAAGNGFRGKTLLKQVELYKDEKRRLTVARALEIGALHNLRANLRYYAKHRPEGRMQEAANKMSELTNEMNANVKQIFTWLGKNFFTWYDKQFFTRYGKQFFTRYGKEFFTLLGKEIFTWYGKQFFTSPYTCVLSGKVPSQLNKSGCLSL